MAFLFYLFERKESETCLRWPPKGAEQPAEQRLIFKREPKLCRNPRGGFQPLARNGAAQRWAQVSAAAEETQTQFLSLTSGQLR